MSLIIVLCDEPCPAHPEIRCLREAGHPLPHKGALKNIRGTDLRGVEGRHRIDIEWRPIPLAPETLASLD
jgi:hypothetical protein